MHRPWLSIICRQTGRKAFDTKTSFSVYHLPDNFDKISDALLKQAALSRVKNALLIAEYNSLNYCLDKVRFRGCIYYGPEAILNNNRFRKGDTLQIMAWIGAIQDRMDLTLSVNGTTLSQKDWEPITYSFAANKQPGHHNLPITLQYRKRDGTMGIASKTLTYDIIL